MNTLHQPVVYQRQPQVVYQHPHSQQVLIQRPPQRGAPVPVQYVQPMAQPMMIRHVQPQQVVQKTSGGQVIQQGTQVQPKAAAQAQTKAHIPLAKCRVLYLGSSVPLETAQGLDAVQLPLKERYPFENQGDVPGIDAWLTIYSSGLMLQYVNDKSAKTWFPIQTLHVCAAVKCIVQLNGATGDKSPKFVALDSEAAKGTRHPPMFACIMRRTKGVKVLECHVFISKSNQAAMALVQSATHAYEHKEGWTDDQPEAEDDARSHTRLIPADPPPKVTAPPEFFKAPPKEGYFYATNKELVKNYNVMGGRKDGDNEQEQAVQSEDEPYQYTMDLQKSKAKMIPPHMDQRNPGAPVPYGPPPMMAPYMAGIPMMPVAPPGYFADWNTFRGRPVAVMGEHMEEGMPYTHHRNRSPRQVREPRQRPPPHRPHVSDYSSNSGYRGHRPSTPPADYDRGNASDPYYDGKAQSDLIMYADNYQNQNQGGDRGDNGGQNSSFSPEIFMRENNDGRERGKDYSDNGEYDDGGVMDDNFDPYNGNYEKELPERTDDRRFPMQDREFSQSMMEERNVVGDYAGYPDAYKMNIGVRERDNESNIDYDIFHRREQETGGFDNLENTLGYFP